MLGSEGALLSNPKLTSILLLVSGTDKLRIKKNKPGALDFTALPAGLPIFLSIWTSPLPIAILRTQDVHILHGARLRTGGMTGSRERQGLETLYSARQSKVALAGLSVLLKGPLQRVAVSLRPGPSEGWRTSCWCFKGRQNKKGPIKWGPQ